MRNARLTLLLSILALAGYGWANAQSDDAPKRKPLVSQKAPPPKFDAVARGAFFKHAGEHLGPAPTAEDLAAPPSNSVVAPAPTEGAFTWSKLVSADVLETEVKALSESLGKAVTSPNDFKGGGFKVARRDFTVLAAIFGVIDQYDGDVRWKQASPGLRDAFSRAGKNCKVGTDGTYAEAKLKAEELAALIRGETPTVGAGTSEIAWNEIADRPPLMERLELARTERLKPWSGSKNEFTAHQEAVAHEAALVAALAEIIGDRSYDFAEDEAYRQHLQLLRQSAAEAQAATTKADFDRLQTAIGAMSKSCDNCHGEYR